MGFTQLYCLLLTNNSRERIYPFRKVGKHPWFIGREMVRQHRRAPGCPQPHRLRFGKITFHRVLSHLIPFNKTLKNRSVSAWASHPPYGVVQHFSIQHTPIKTLPGGTDKSVPYEISVQLPTKQKAPPVGETFLYVGITYLPGKCNVLSCRCNTPVECCRHLRENEKPHPKGHGHSYVGITYLPGKSPCKYCRRR